MRRLQIQILTVIMLGLLASACTHEAETDRDGIITSNSQQTTQITEDGDTEIVLDETKWSMVWVSDFGLEKYPNQDYGCLLYTSPSPRDQRGSRMPSSA